MTMNGAGAGATGPAAPLLLIRGAAVYAPQSLGVQDVLLGGGRVLELGPSLPVPQGLTVQVLDARGLVVCPGFIDSLVHVGGGGGEGGFATRFPPLQAEQAIESGVTTVIGALGTDDVTRSHADLLACCRALNASGLSAFALSGSYRVPVRSLTGCLRSDLVLIPDLIGVGELAIADSRSSQPSADELGRIGADVRVAGLLAGKRTVVLVHVGDEPDGLEALRQVDRRHALPIDLWHPTHINRQRRLLEEGLAWLDAGGSIDLTTSTTPDLLAAGEIPAAEALAWLASKRGTPHAITLSSDAQASLPHFDAAGRLQSLEAAPIGSLLSAVVAAVQCHGLKLPDALRAVTLNPAEVWGLVSKGRIAAGTDADLVLLEPDSLRPVAVIASGRLHVTRNGHDLSDRMTPSNGRVPVPEVNR